jgi:hypothetical protein
MCQIRRIEVRTIFFETNIMSDLSYTLCEKDCAYYPCDCQSVNQINSDLFSLSKFPSSRCEKWRFVNQSLLLSSQIIFRMLKSIRTSARTSISRTSASKWLVREHRFRALLCGCEM